MKLNATILYEKIREMADVTLLGEGQEELTLHFPCFYDGSLKHLQAGGVYLAPNDLLPREAPQEQNILWVSWSGKIPRTIPKCPVLFFNQETDPKYILNLVQSVFIQFNLWEDKINEILAEDSSVKAIIDASEDLFSHPLCVVDSSLSYLGYSRDFLSSPLYQEGSEKISPAAALFYDEEDDLRSSLSNHSFVLGTLYMIHNKTPFSQTERLMFKILGDKLTQALKNLSMLSGLYQNSFKEQMKNLFITHHAEKNKLMDAFKEWGGSPDDTLLCYKVKASHLNQKINAEYI